MFSECLPQLQCGYCKDKATAVDYGSPYLLQNPLIY